MSVRTMIKQSEKTIQKSVKVNAVVEHTCVLTVLTNFIELRSVFTGNSSHSLHKNYMTSTVSTRAPESGHKSRSSSIVVVE